MYPAMPASIISLGPKRSVSRPAGMRANGNGTVISVWRRLTVAAEPVCVSSVQDRLVW